jgi:hypothetical protein
VSATSNYPTEEWWASWAGIIGSTIKALRR